MRTINTTAFPVSNPAIIYQTLYRVLIGGSMLKELSTKQSLAMVRTIKSLADILHNCLLQLPE